MSKDYKKLNPFAIKLLEMTIQQNRHAMEILGEGLVSIAQDFQVLTENSNIPSDTAVLFTARLDGMIQAMQSHDITDQRLSHVLAVLNDPNVELREVLTEQTEFHVLEAVEKNMPFSLVADRVPQEAQTSNVELF